MFSGAVQIKAHDLAQFNGLGAIDGQHESLLEKRVMNALQVAIQRDNAVAASLVGKADQQAREFSQQFAFSLDFWWVYLFY